MEKVLNINVGVLGHVDSGKTSLVRALSDTFSTASLDKSKQSRQRGITLDLGFSSFKAPIPPHLEEELRPIGIEGLQFTLVDCPGHAGLMKTVIGGAQIIDLMILVIDVNKMIQVQTGECLVLGNILTESLIAVLNKCDTLSDKTKEKQLKKKRKELRKVFKKTKFGKHVPIACVTANRGGQNSPGEDTEYDRDTEKTSTKSDIQELLDLLLTLVKIPERKSKNFLYSVDHCFTIKGKGTILTGTVLQGTCKVNQIVELPALKLERKVKSMQAFRKPVEMAVAGDRVAVCLNQVSSNDLERAVVCEPGTVPTLTDVIVRMDRVQFYRREVSSGVKFHVSIGHSTTMALLTCFRDPTRSEFLYHGYRGEEK
jgi:selenocysteine-specific elongation factor